MSGSHRPVRWRQAVVTFACVYPTSLLLSLVVPALTAGWPWPLSTALTAALLVAALT
jgi:antibiotic biosynthesis monooxygenase (ABM) superfamily enzyme